ncbi:MAG: hypothetical protein U0X20_27540 [Caldilineaceae bacterium]
MATNDELLRDLHEYTRQVLKLEHVVDVQDNLYGGWNNAQRAVAVATVIDGYPAIVVDASYTKWPAGDLVEVFLHEAAHHINGDVPRGRLRAYLVAHPPQPTAAGVQASERSESKAWAFAKAQRAQFETWRKQQQLQRLQVELWELRQLVLGRQVGKQLAARQAQPKRIQPKFNRR